MVNQIYERIVHNGCIHMRKIRQVSLALLTAALLLSGCFPAFTAKADGITEAPAVKQSNAQVSDEETTGEETTEEASSPETADTEEQETQPPVEEETETVEEEETETETDAEEETKDPEEETEDPEEETDAEEETEITGEEETAPLAEEEAGTPTEEETISTAGFPIPDEPPAFDAHIEYSYGGYQVIGTFTDFTPDITRIETLYSLDGKNWQTNPSFDWNLYGQLEGLKNQPCLFATKEPLKSYLAGKADRIYVKLRITKENGLSYETQCATIERGGLQPIPEGTEYRASFSSDILASESVPGKPPQYRRRYGRYQLTVFADSTAEEISALLPDTLPVQVDLDHGADFIAIGVVDCPVTWKPLSLPPLSPGESATISDAAEEIIVPEGTLLSTPVGIFRLDRPVSLDNPPSTDEVRLVLNVTEDRNPAGALREGTNGLEIAFHHNATGAASIEAYVMTEGESKWTPLPDVSLLEELNQPSTANSGYALVLPGDQEPYRSYLADTAAGKTPVPFFIGLKIKGGIYDGRQLILAWPDIYDQLPELPEVGGAGGNEGNAGAANKDDSTETGQRPNLPQIQDNDPGSQQEDPAQTSDDKTQSQTDPALWSENQIQNQQTDPALAQTVPALIPETVPVAMPESQNTSSADGPGESFSGQQSGPGYSFAPEQRPDQPQQAPDTPGAPISSQEAGLLPAPPVVLQAAAELIKEKITAHSPDMKKAVIEYAAEKDRLIPLLLTTSAVAAGGCIGVAICKTAGYRLLRWVVGKIHNIHIPHK